MSIQPYQKNFYYFKSYLKDLIVTDWKKTLTSDDLKKTFETIINIYLSRTTFNERNTYTSLCDLKKGLAHIVDMNINPKKKCSFMEILNKFFNFNTSFIQNVENEYIQSLTDPIQQFVCSGLTGSNCRGPAKIDHDIIQCMRETFRTKSYRGITRFRLHLKYNLKTHLPHPRGGESASAVNRAIALVEKFSHYTTYVTLSSTDTNNHLFNGCPIGLEKKILFTAILSFAAQVHQFRLVCKQWTIWIDTPKSAEIIVYQPDQKEQAGKLAQTLFIYCNHQYTVPSYSYAPLLMLFLALALEAFSENGDLDEIISIEEIKQALNKLHVNFPIPEILTEEITTVGLVFASIQNDTKAFAETGKIPMNKQALSLVMIKEAVQRAANSPKGQFIYTDVTHLTKLVSFLNTIFEFVNMLPLNQKKFLGTGSLLQ